MASRTPNPTSERAPTSAVFRSTVYVVACTLAGLVVALGSNALTGRPRFGDSFATTCCAAVATFALGVVLAWRVPRPASVPGDDLRPWTARDAFLVAGGATWTLLFVSRFESPWLALAVFDAGSGPAGQLTVVAAPLVAAVSATLALVLARKA
ncbi:MAG: hypothetical protein U0169_07700 [Polyangiaceae bacterium]